MMNKILIEVYVVVIKEGFDLWVANTMKIEEVIACLQQGLLAIRQEEYKYQQNCLLCFKNDGCVLRNDEIIGAYNIRNGTKLLLI